MPPRHSCNRRLLIADAQQDERHASSKGGKCQVGFEKDDACDPDRNDRQCYHMSTGKPGARMAIIRSFRCCTCSAELWQEPSPGNQGDKNMGQKIGHHYSHFVPAQTRSIHP